MLWPDSAREERFSTPPLLKLVLTAHTSATMAVSAKKSKDDVTKAFVGWPGLAWALLEAGRPGPDCGKNVFFGFHRPFLHSFVKTVFV